MIADVRFGTDVLEPVVDGGEGQAEIDSLDAAEEVPLSAGLWLNNGTELNGELDDRGAVRRVSTVQKTDRGSLYRVSYGDGFEGADIYRVAVDSGGLFTGGTAGPSGWTIRMRFPGRDAVTSVRDRCEARGLDVDVTTVGGDAGPYADQFGLTAPQRQALVAAARGGYFEVPRRTSLSGLAGELGVSSQAASERIRRGLDSLVGGALLGDRGD